MKNQNDNGHSKDSKKGNSNKINDKNDLSKSGEKSKQDSPSYNKESDSYGNKSK